MSPARTSAIPIIDRTPSPNPAIKTISKIPLDNV
jgi:hypothetical protein